MKCGFNDFIKANDVICMPLYRRVFPPYYEKCWNPLAKEPVMPKQETYDRDQQGDMTD
ncbi:MAG: hypothetical protein ACK521_02365 [bacterium]|jgi:hypothetical protein